MNAVTHTQRGTQKKVEKGLLFFAQKKKILTRPFSTFLIFYRTLHLETCALTASSPKARRGVSSLSLILLFYCYHCAWCEDII